MKKDYYHELSYGCELELEKVGDNVRLRLTEADGRRRAVQLSPPQVEELIELLRQISS